MIRVFEQHADLPIAKNFTASLVFNRRPADDSAYRDLILLDARGLTFGAEATHRHRPLGHGIYDAIHPFEGCKE